MVGNGAETSLNLFFKSKNRDVGICIVRIIQSPEKGEICIEDQSKKLQMPPLF